MMVPFVKGWTSLIEGSVIGALAAVLAAVVKGRFTWRGVRDLDPQHAGDHRACSCWIILAALSFGAVFDGLGAGRAIESFFVEQTWALGPGNPDPDAAFASWSWACSWTIPRCW